MVGIARTLGSDWSKSPEHWGQIGRNRPNIGVRLVGIARTLGSDWAKSPEHWGADGSTSPEGIYIYIYMIGRVSGLGFRVSLLPDR